MNICYAIYGDKFHLLTLQNINNILRFVPNPEKVNIYILYNGEIKHKHSDYTYIETPPDIQKLPLMHQRIHIPEILHTSAGINRVLFLDSDVYATCNISELWRVELRQKILGAVPHYHFKTIQQILQYYGLSELYNKTNHSNQQVFNGGVKLIDIKKYLSSDVISTYNNKVLMNEKYHVINNEEPFINDIFAGQWLKLAGKWNHYPGMKWKSRCLIHPYGHDIANIRKVPNNTHITSRFPV